MPNIFLSPEDRASNVYASSAVLAGILSLLTSLAGLPELEE